MFISKKEKESILELIDSQEKDIINLYTKIGDLQDSVKTLQAAKFGLRKDGTPRAKPGPKGPRRKGVERINTTVQKIIKEQEKILFSDLARKMEG
jgi:hypothetical protein